MLTADPPHMPKYLVNNSADPHFQITPACLDQSRRSARNPASIFLQIRRFYNSSDPPRMYKTAPQIRPTHYLVK